MFDLYDEEHIYYVLALFYLSMNLVICIQNWTIAQAFAALHILWYGVNSHKNIFEPEINKKKCISLNVHYIICYSIYPHLTRILRELRGKNTKHNIMYNIKKTSLKPMECSCVSACLLCLQARYDMNARILAHLAWLLFISSRLYFICYWIASYCFLETKYFKCLTIILYTSQSANQPYIKSIYLSLPY